MTREDKIAQMLWWTVVRAVRQARNEPNKTAEQLADEVVADWTIIDGTMG